MRIEAWPMHGPLNSKDIFAKLDYAKQLKKDQYDYYYDMDLDGVIRKLQNLIVINY